VPGKFTLDKLLHYPSLDPDLQMIRDLFTNRETFSGLPFTEIRNPHPEKPVTEEVKSKARSSAVLIAVTESKEPKLLVTKRHHGIRFAGHICFPGGITDEGDASTVATALRETWEEIHLDSSEVEVLGELGEYYTQAGFRINPVVGLVKPGFSVLANPDEVEEIYEVSLRKVLCADSYSLTWHSSSRGHFSFQEGDVRIAGPTVSLLIGLYEELLRFKGLLQAG
jgi:8-oxo-dGTP pyrophosphatase MutT (NUDIX family)